MKVNVFALKRLDDLVEEGERLFAQQRVTNRVASVPLSNFVEWRTRSVNARRSLLGDNAPLTNEFGEKIIGARASTVQVGLGILRGLAKDVEAGYLTSIENMIATEVFSDFLEMAERLLDLEQGHVPAASLIGAVLEDSLRRLADTLDASYKPSDDITILNAKLASGKVRAYNREQQREIEWWKAIRDNADHGRFTDVERDKVSNMLAGVRRFVAAYMS